MLVKFHHFQPQVFVSFQYSLTKQRRNNTALTRYRVFTILFSLGGGGVGGRRKEGRMEEGAYQLF